MCAGGRARGVRVHPGSMEAYGWTGRGLNRGRADGLEPAMHMHCRPVLSPDLAEGEGQEEEARGEDGGMGV